MLKLIKFEKEDEHFLEKSLDLEYISRWFGDPKYWLQELEYEKERFFFLEYTSDIVEKIGFCRYSEEIPREYFEKSACENKEELKKYLLHKNTFSDFSENVKIFCIDYAICLEKYLNKSFGHIMLNLLINSIKKELASPFILLASSSLKNIASCKVLQKNGFSYDKEIETFVKIIPHYFHCLPNQL